MLKEINKSFKGACSVCGEFLKVLKNLSEPLNKTARPQLFLIVVYSVAIY